MRPPAHLAQSAPPRCCLCDRPIGNPARPVVWLKVWRKGYETSEPACWECADELAPGDVDPT